MNGNPHIEDAARYINEASSLHDWPITERGIIAANGQALTTLALAYEQRTANLIALISLDRVGGYVANRGAFAEIESRLGLSEGATK